MFKSYLNGKESKTDDEISNPVDSNGDSGSHRSSSRSEKFCNEEPRNRSRSSGEKDDVDDDQNDAEVGQPARHILYYKYLKLIDNR